MRFASHGMVVSFFGKNVFAKCTGGESFGDTSIFLDPIGRSLLESFITGILSCHEAIGSIKRFVSRLLKKLMQ